ncbi:c-type cytochrome [Sphingobium sp. ZW T5_29]|uniref:c-type cytochrome n=1 Tax=Sphingobium sp. ZW T5_29 TaxID=3378077 RepID=UPI003854896D
MIRMRWLLTGMCVAGAAASLWSLNWFAGQLYSTAEAGDLAYVPDDTPARIDMAQVQRDWPASLGGPGEANRVIALRNQMQGKAPMPSASGSKGAVEPIIDLGTLLATANLDTGKAKVQLCVSCHDLARGGPNRIGPNLWDVVGRGVATQAGFAYSPAMKGHGGTWGYHDLFEFLASPARDVPGTKMAFAGLRKPEDRAALIRYLATLGDGAPPLPQPSQSGEGAP